MKGKNLVFILLLSGIFFMPLLIIDGVYSYILLKNYDVTNRDNILFLLFSTQGIIYIAMILMLLGLFHYYPVLPDHIKNLKKRRSVKYASQPLSIMAKEQSEFFTRTLQSIPSTVLVLDRDGRILQSNQSKIFGHPCKQGVHYLEFVNVLGVCPEKSVVWKSFQQQKAVSEISKIWTNISQEDIRNIYVITEPMFDEEGEFDALVAIFLDITEHTPLAEQLKALNNPEFVANVAATIGHEVGNPLTTVRGFAQLLQRDKNMTTEQKIALQWVIKETDRAISVIDDLVRLARTHSYYNYQSVNMRGLLQSISILFEKQIKQCNGQLHFEVPMHLNVYGDLKRLRQVILQLLQNAVQALPEKGGQIWIAVKQEDQQRIQIDIRDNGKGISPQQLEQIRRPFFTTKEMATGLGLPLAYQIIEEHQGYIEIFSEEGQGTLVRINLPDEKASVMMATSA
ncbi:two-component system sensor histidine kinase NtrB [Heliorestis convoluta]|uniref:histidine kinase n=1 Tax=Heliorestis convoluta TaxID=356322 RepID=A0A5Q2MZ41_9FIRM|nr:ATP-binding protein [Heliorestis convoluta]QGG46192.1 PAS domain S-box [Heliorestis convoluta]